MATTNMKKLTTFFALILLCLSALAEAKNPELATKDVKKKIEEILRVHASEHFFTQEIAERSLESFIEHLDPHKTYFLQNEVASWIAPSAELLQKVVDEYKKENFNEFFAIHAVFVEAVARRRAIETEIKSLAILQDVNRAEFKDLKFATDRLELQDRLLKTRSLQYQSVAKLSSSDQDLLFQKIDKWRTKKESEFLTESSLEQKNIILVHVLKAICTALDSQTLYFTPQEANQFIIQVQQKLSGTGIQLRDDLVGFTAMRIVEGSPAAKCGLINLGDQIIAVDHEPVIGMEISDAVELIRGPEGSQVTLTIVRHLETESKKDETFDVVLTRGEIVLQESRLETKQEPYGDGIIGILSLRSFYQDPHSSSASDLQDALEAMQKEAPLKGVILDLRNNLGGLLSQTVNVCSLFLKKGIIVSVKDHTNEIQHLRNTEDRKIYDGPLLVLVNKASASSSEIVAQTLRDYGRAILVGDPETFGKGTFQTFTLESSNYGNINTKGEYKVTRGRWYSVGGKCPQLEGIVPDIIVAGPLSKMEIGERYSKFPLGSDAIEPNFEDTLIDVSLIHRANVQKLYKFNLQEVMEEFLPYLPLLKKNTDRRIAQNINYQLFLKSLESDDSLSDAIESYGESDLQLQETLQIMKDFIFLHSGTTNVVAPAA